MTEGQELTQDRKFIRMTFLSEEEYGFGAVQQELNKITVVDLFGTYQAIVDETYRYRNTDARCIEITFDDGLYVAYPSDVPEYVLKGIAHLLWAKAFELTIADQQTRARVAQQQQMMNDSLTADQRNIAAQIMRGKH